MSEPVRTQFILNGRYVSDPDVEDLMAAYTKLSEFLNPIRAAAWDEGYKAGHSRAMRRMSDEPNVEDAINPYRSAE
jgi:hypothetical protein